MHRWQKFAEKLNALASVTAFRHRNAFREPKAVYGVVDLYSGDARFFEVLNQTRES